MRSKHSPFILLKDCSSQGCSLPPFVSRIEVLVDMPVDRHGEGGTDGGFFQKERIEMYPLPAGDS